MAAWLYRRPDSKKWWIGWRSNGKQYLQSTGKITKAEAEKKLHEFHFVEQSKHDRKLTQAMIESLTDYRAPSLSLDSTLTEWLNETEGACSSSTFDRYHGIADDLRTHLNVTPKGPLLHEVTSAEIQAFLSAVRTKSSASTVNLYRKVLSSFFIRALKRNLIRSNPVTSIKSFKAGKGEKSSRRAFTIEEVRLIFSKAPDEFWRFMVLAGFYTGARLGDLACLTWGNIDFQQNLLRLTTGKTDTHVRVPMAGALKVMMLDLYSRSADQRASSLVWKVQASRYLELGAKVLSKEFYEILASCGLVKPRPKQHKAEKSGRDGKRELGLSFHCFRHTFITFLRTTGGNQAVAKELAGHSSSVVNDGYTHLPLSELQKAIAQLPEVLI